MLKKTAVETPSNKADPNADANAVTLNRNGDDQMKFDNLKLRKDYR